MVVFVAQREDTAVVRWVLLIGIAVLGGACGPGGRDAPGRRRGWGGGVVQSESEECDDAARNGTGESLCTLDCQDRTLTAEVIGQTSLPVPARKLIRVRPCFQGEWLVASNFDDQGIALVSTEGAGTYL